MKKTARTLFPPVLLVILLIGAGVVLLRWHQRDGDGGKTPARSYYVSGVFTPGVVTTGAYPPPKSGKTALMRAMRSALARAQVQEGAMAHG